MFMRSETSLSTARLNKNILTIISSMSFDHMFGLNIRYNKSHIVYFNPLS